MSLSLTTPPPTSTTDSPTTSETFTTTEESTTSLPPTSVVDDRTAALVYNKPNHKWYDKRRRPGIGRFIRADHLAAAQTTVVQTTVIVTSNGQQVTSVFEVSSTITPSSTSGASSSNDDGSSSSNTGAIVGGVSRRLSKLFDGNFDPAAVGRAPDMGVDLNDERADGMGGRLAGADIGAGVSPPSPPPMSQYSHDSHYPSIYSQYASVPMPAGMPGPQPVPSMSGRSSSAGGGMSAKERERVHGLNVANPDGPSSGPVLVHQDAGPSEIPPTYDSLLPRGGSSQPRDLTQRE
ncbi:hypothetical protein CPB85DRAFT_1251143 [Mucidula mucida]|nr:hypothetical protein CPB85DRAFT_1251143 [Mucidula mucida]